MILINYELVKFTVLVAKGINFIIRKNKFYKTKIQFIFLKFISRLL